MITRHLRLSELRKLVDDDRTTDGQVNPRTVRSIQQSLATEGYVSTEEAVRLVGERMARQG